MKACTYCGRENDDTAVQCLGCGTEMQTPQAMETLTFPTFKTIKALLRQPSTLAWLSAAVVIVQAWFTPHGPFLGDGDVESIDAAIYFWKSVGIATILGLLGLYFWSNRKDARWD